VGGLCEHLVCRGKVSFHTFISFFLFGFFITRTGHAGIGPIANLTNITRIGICKLNRRICNVAMTSKCQYLISSRRLLTGGEARRCDGRVVCLSVCLSACISPKPPVQASLYFQNVLHVAVTKSSDALGIRYVQTAI